MITPIIFSRDRPAQLDLLIRSGNIHAGFSPIVIYRASNDGFLRGYSQCRELHRNAAFLYEVNFKRQFELMLAMAFPHTMLLCDDDFFYRDLEYGSWCLDQPDVLCFSTRLGENTTYCYPLDQEQAIPDFEQLGQYRTWRWMLASNDFGYPGSIDGTIFRTAQLLEIVREGTYANPNQLEEWIQLQTRSYFLPKMASFNEGCVVGLPVNIVNTTHPNRSEHSSSVEEINDRFLSGERLSLGTVDPARVNAAHTPFELRWEMND